MAARRGIHIYCVQHSTEKTGHKYISTCFERQRHALFLFPSKTATTATFTFTIAIAIGRIQSSYLLFQYFPVDDFPAQPVHQVLLEQIHQSLGEHAAGHCRLGQQTVFLPHRQIQLRKLAADLSLDLRIQLQLLLLLRGVRVGM